MTVGVTVAHRTTEAVAIRKNNAAAADEDTHGKATEKYRLGKYDRIYEQTSEKNCLPCNFAQTYSIKLELAPSIGFYTEHHLQLYNSISIAVLYTAS